jgi:peptidoglycan/LPS O-acetylase OafA/YrhL
MVTIFVAYTILIYIQALFIISLLNRTVSLEPNEGPGFSPPLEALRGVAAMMVFACHSMMYFTNLVPQSAFPSFMGAAGVILFFFLTGHLFWSQVLSGTFKVDAFFPKRVRRIVPAATIMVAFVMLTDWLFLANHPRIDFGSLILLIRNFAFGFGGTNDVFYPETAARMNVIWSLKWEWLFYLCLPLAANFKGLFSATAFTATLIFVFYDPRHLFTGVDSEAVFVLAFYLGGALAYLDRAKEKTLRTLGIIFTSPYYLFLVVSAIYIYLSHISTSAVPYRQLPILALGFSVFLYFWASKYKPQKWMGRRPVQMIGQVSFSLYLWHLVINWYVAHLAIQWFGSNTLAAYLVLSAIMLFLALTLATYSYIYIERRFMLGKRTAQLAMQPGLTLRTDSMSPSTNLTA